MASLTYQRSGRCVPGDPVRALAALAILLGGVASCTFRWDDLDDELPFTNAPVPLAPSGRINTAPVIGPTSIVTGADGEPWAAFCGRWDTTSFESCFGVYRRCTRLHLVRLAAPVREETLEADGFTVHAKTVIAESVVAGHVRLRLHRPGDPSARDELLDDAWIGLGPDEDVIVSWANFFRNPDAYAKGRGLGVHRRDPPDAGWSFIPISSYTIVHGFQFTRDGRRLVLLLEDPPYQAVRIVVRAVDDGTTLVAGELPHVQPLGLECGEDLPRLTVDEASDQVIVPTVRGLDAVSLSTGAERVLLPPEGPFPPYLGQPFHVAGPDVIFAAYTGDPASARPGIFRAPLDGHAPAERVRDDVFWILRVGPRGELIYSPTDYSTYASHAAEGWLQIAGAGAWRIMERGLYPTFSRDGARVRFLDHAATLDAVGELHSLALPLPAAPRDRTGDASTIIAHNANCFDEAPDGRVLVVENHGAPGPWNRLVRIDEARRTKEWVAPGADCFSLIPGRNEALVYVLRAPNGYDIHRVSLPE